MAWERRSEILHPHLRPIYRRAHHYPDLVLASRKPLSAMRSFSVALRPIRRSGYRPGGDGLRSEPYGLHLLRPLPAPLPTARFARPRRGC